MIKKLLKLFGIIVLIVILGGSAGVVVERIIMPWLSSFESFSRLSFFQKANERVTVINKTEQVTVKEDFSVTKITQNVLPSVVSIITHGEAGIANMSDNIQSDREIRSSVRTGLILTGDGLVMSVAKEGEVFSDDEIAKKQNKILVSDGRELDAELLSYDPYTGLVFYKINAMNLPAPPLGNSDELQSGEKIILAGNAGGEYQNTFSVGVINQKDKTFTLLNSELSFSEKMEGVILTDAHVRQDNIGGPVIDFNGTVVGIVNQIEKNGEAVGYIMPINALQNSIDRIIQSGEISRAQLGAYYLSIDRKIALLNNLPVNEGALVYSFSGQRGLAVIKNSPADIAGITIGDIITKINDEKITLKTPLSAHIAKYNKGDEITLSMIRDNNEKEIKLRLQ